MKRLKSNRGQASIEFLVVAVILFVVVFGIYDYWIAAVRLQNGEHLKNYYLNRTRIEGILTADDRADMIAAYNNIGLDVVSVDTPAARVERTLAIGAGSYPDVWLNIETEFQNPPFMIGLFVGDDGVYRPVFRGRALSEYSG